MNIKKQSYRLHSWIGIKLSILFFVVCFSGTLATISKELDWLFNHEIRIGNVQGKALADRNTIRDNIKRKYPEGKITYWKRHDETYLCDIIYLLNQGKRTYLFANPYTGKLQGEAKVTIQRFFRDFHYYLFFPLYQIGYFIVLTFGFLLFITLITSFLFFKRWWTKFSDWPSGKNPVQFFRSFHRVVGLWASPFILLFSLTGIWYFLERTDTAGIKTTSNPSPPKLSEVRQECDSLSLGYTIDFDKAIQVAEDQIEGFKVASLNAPARCDAPIYLRGKSEVPLVRQRANRVYLDPMTYEVLHVQDARDNKGSVMWMNDIMDPLHFGTWGGLWTKIIWFVSGLAICSLILTGIWISLKKNISRRKKAKKNIMGRWRYLNWSIYILVMIASYAMLAEKYNVALDVFGLVSAFWVTFFVLGYYIFVIRIKRRA